MPHTQFIFTQPHELLGLNEANPRLLHQHFFRTVATTLRIESRRMLGIWPSYFAALQTWGSPMNHHVHIHVCFLCGGLSPDGQQWIAPPDDAPCFLDLKQLARTYRDCFLQGLERLFLQQVVTRHPLELRGVPTHDPQGHPIAAEAGFLQLVGKRPTEPFLTSAIPWGFSEAKIREPWYGKVDSGSEASGMGGQARAVRSGRVVGESLLSE